MKNKFYMLCLAFLFFCVIKEIGAQEKDKGSIVKLKSGLTVVFRSETDPPSNRQQNIGTYEVAGENNVIHRAFLDAERGIYFGYDVEIESSADANKFKLTFKPLSSINYISISKNLTTNSPGKEPQTTSRSVVLSPINLSKYPEPQTIRGGDTVAFDVLINPQTGVKIVDLIKISASADQQPTVSSKNGKAKANRKRAESSEQKKQVASSRQPDSAGENRPSDFTIDAVELNLTSAYLSINGKRFGKVDDSGGTNLSGALLWFYLPGRGRFIMSLSPRPGYKFQKLGTISGNQISFEFNGNKYEWISTSPILSLGKRAWNLWVLPEPTFTPADRPNGGISWQVGSSNSLESLFREK
jgi:hypothetical protein